MSDEWLLESSARGTSRAIVGALLVSLIAIAAAGSYVAASVVVGQGTLGITVVAPPTAIEVKFYSDQNATQEITSVQIPQGTSATCYVKLRNTGSSVMSNLFVSGGGDRVWMNVWKLDGTDLYSGGQSHGTFSIGGNSYIILKVQVGHYNTVGQGFQSTLYFDVNQE
ncbi:MAG: hypothetical protein QXG10_01645 [Candidatus Hadarchaeales archaeon]